MSQTQATAKDDSSPHGLRKVVDNQSVGEVLRNGRLALGEDLTEVAEGLKIRRAFIEALENDEFSALPGTAYGIGFARAYAEYLDLDSEEIVEMFKAQSRAFDDQTQLVFPEPMPGSRVPTGLVIVLSVLLIGAAYGGWAVLSDENRSLQDLVPSVPAFLSESGEEATETAAVAETSNDAVSDSDVATVETTAEESVPATAADAVEEQSVAVANTVEAAVQDQADTEAVAAETEAAVEETAATVEDTVAEAEVVATEQIDTVVEDSQATLSEVEAPVDEVTSLETAEPVVDEAEVVAAVNAVETEGSVEPVIEEVTADVPAVTEAAVEEPVLEEPVVSAVETTAPELEETSAVAEEPVPAVEPVAETDIASTNEVAEDDVIAAIPEVAADNVTIYGETEGASRVSIVARQAAWVEVSDAEGTVLLNRLLLKGDVYQAPDQAGLTLVTGNAGGLEFRVDGVTVPDVGAVGSVQRNVSLSPDKLQAGQATAQE